MYRGGHGYVPTLSALVAESPFVGRSAELGRLGDELNKTRDGARLVLVVGEAGVGKTRLVTEFQVLARARARCLIGRGSPLGSAIPFSLIVTLSS